jgi:alkaline phosphatase D
MNTTRRKFLKTAAAGAAGAAVGGATSLPQSAAASFTSAFPPNTERVFVGPEYWANRLQDWRVSGGRVECVDSRPASPMRTLHLLTHRLGAASTGFAVSAQTGLSDASLAAADAATGFLIGAGGAKMDYRAAALIHHQPGPGGAVFAGCDARGQVFFRDFEKPQPKLAIDPPLKDAPSEIRVELTAKPRGAVSELTLVARDSAGRELSRLSQDFPNVKLAGNVALVSHPGAGSR